MISKLQLLKTQDVFYDKRNTVVADVPEWLDFRAEAAKFVITFLTIWITM